MDTNWIFQEPIDLEHKQYVLLSYLQKIDNQLKNFKLYPIFQFLSLHLANVNLMLQKGQYLILTRTLKEKDDEILISDLVGKEIETKSVEDLIEIINICNFASKQLQDYFDHAKAIWEIVNESVSLETIANHNNFKNREGLFIIENNGKNYLYEFIIKDIKKNTVESKCCVKKICELIDNKIDYNLFKNKKTIIKNLSDIEKHENLIIFKVTHNKNFPFYDTLLPIVKRKINNFINQSKIISKKKLTKID